MPSIPGTPGGPGAPPPTLCLKRHKIIFVILFSPVRIIGVKVHAYKGEIIQPAKI